MSGLPVKRAFELDEREEESRWLVEHLWGENAVGLIGGEPKSFKSFLALDLAVSVASGKHCLGYFSVARQGPVLLYAAEDALADVRKRLHDICKNAQVKFDRLNVHVITAPRLRIDQQADRQALIETVQKIKPILVVLDPFVRLHGVDENASGEVSKVLGFLRDLQRTESTAICVVHHARKRAGRERPGQSLRGSSEFHAWGDSNLYVRRTGTEEDIEMTIEHRSAPSRSGICLGLDSSGDGLALRYKGAVKAGETTTATRAEDRIALALSGTEGLTGEDLRSTCQMKSSTFWAALTGMIDKGDITKQGSHYHAT